MVPPQVIISTPLPASTVFLFGTYNTRRAGWPRWCQYDQQSHSFRFQECFTTQNCLYEARNRPPFRLSCLISWGCSSSEPSRFSAVTCWNLSKLRSATLGSLGRERRFRDTFALLKQFLLFLSRTVFTHLSPPPPQPEKHVPDRDASFFWVPFHCFTVPSRKPRSICRMCPCPFWNLGRMMYLNILPRTDTHLKAQ